jgi:amino acid transporter
VSDPNSPLGLLIFGMGIMFLAMVYTCIGKVSDHSFGWVERSNDSRGYWLTLAVYYLGGLSFIGFYLYKVHASSR